MDAKKLNHLIHRLENEPLTLSLLNVAVDTLKQFAKTLPPADWASASGILVWMIAGQPRAAGPTYTPEPEDIDKRLSYTRVPLTGVPSCQLLTEAEVISIRKGLKPQDPAKAWSDTLAVAEAIQLKFMEVNGLCQKLES